VQETITKLSAEEQDSEPEPENPFLPILGAVTDLGLLFNYKSIIAEVFETLNSGGGVALVGSTGMGKSSFLKVIEKQSEEKLSIKRKPIYFNLSDIQDDRDYYQAMKDLLGLPSRVEGYTFTQQVRQTSEKFLLLLDGIEQLTWTGFTKPVRTQLRSLANDINPPLRLVVAATDNLTKLFADSGLDSPFEGICQEIILPPWTEDIMQQFITSRLAGTSVNFTEQERKIIMQKSQGNPRRLMQECHKKYIKYRSNSPR
jgi:ABC-type dipeptide/oligopeptide/nickel transport system ATPase component